MNIKKEGGIAMEKDKGNLIRGIVLCALSAAAFIYASSMPPRTITSHSIIDNTQEIMVLQGIGAALLIAGVLSLVFFFKEPNKPE